jgi:hypothetical protein
MAKDTFYFSHDYNARNDEKIKRLIKKHLYRGYGIYWAIIEDLYNNANALQLDYDGIAFDLHEDAEIVKSVIHDFGLFVFNGDIFGSLSVQKRLDERNSKSKKARESALYRWNNTTDNTNAIRTQCDSNAIKERKEKERKEKESIGITDSEILTHKPNPEIEKNLPPKGRLGIDYRPAYSDLDEEFRKMYSEVFWKSYLAIIKHIQGNCLFLKDWENQITIKDFKVIFDKIQDGVYKIEDVRQALLDLDGSKQAKDKYNSVYHGLNVYINTILRSKK